MDDLPSCHGKKMERVIGKPYVQADIKPYKSMVTGEMITSRSQHREHLKRHNLLEIGNEIKAHMEPKKPKIDNSRRKAQIADVLNGKS